MEIRVECPCCDTMNTLDLEKYEIDPLTFFQSSRLENLEDICRTCGDCYSFDIEIDLNIITFTNEWN